MNDDPGLVCRRRLTSTSRSKSTRRKEGAREVPPGSATRSFTGVAATSPGKQAVIAVKGLACPFCVHGLKKHLLRLPGAKTVDISLARSEAVVTFDSSSKVTEQQIAGAVRKAGFTPGKIEWRVPSGS